MTDHNDVFTSTEPPAWLNSSDGETRPNPADGENRLNPPDGENPSSSTNWRFRAAPVLGVPGFFNPDGFDMPSLTSGMASYDGSG